VLLARRREGVMGSGSVAPRILTSAPDGGEWSVYASAASPIEKLPLATNG